MSLPNLFWKNPEGTRGLLATPFKTEEEFEKAVFETPEILEDIFLLKRQIRGGSKTGIPDIIGVDNDGNVCIIEMKNVDVDASIIPQVLQYAFWAESNPDSIKSLWLECDNKPENLSISWESFGVRILVISPRILRSTLDIVEKINYVVDLVEVNRWVEGTNTIFLVSRLEAEKKSIKIKPVKGLQVYNDAFYKNNYNKQSAAQFLKYVKEVEDIVKARDWTLEIKFNKSYCAFKAGFFNAFGIQWIGTKTFAFFFKISEVEAKEVGIPITKYEAQWKQALCYIDPGKTKTKNYLPLFEKAYKKVAGGD
jgi:hypothetical protein